MVTTSQVRSERETPQDMLQEIVRRISMLGSVDRITLFGSRARGDYRPTSDYDILVVSSSSAPRYRRARPYYRALSDLPIEAEVVVYTPEEVDEWKNVRLAFIT